MQTTGYIIEEKTRKKIKVLVRHSRYQRYLKLRKSGRDGIHLSDEEIFLNKNKDKLNNLKNGKVIFC